jgi:hypothetical protein
VRPSSSTTAEFAPLDPALQRSTYHRRGILARRDAKIRLSSSALASTASCLAVQAGVPGARHRARQPNLRALPDHVGIPVRDHFTELKESGSRFRISRRCSRSTAPPTISGGRRWRKQWPRCSRMPGSPATGDISGSWKATGRRPPKSADPQATTVSMNRTDFGRASPTRLRNATRRQPFQLVSNSSDFFSIKKAGLCLDQLHDHTAE